MNLKKKLEGVTIRTKSKGILGSGIIFKLSDTAETIFIVTAQHNILGENFGNGAKNKDIRIEKFTDKKRIFKYKLTKSDTVTHLENDITIIEIPLNNFIDDFKVETIRISKLDKYVGVCHFSGYPKYGSNLKERVHPVNPDFLNPNDISTEFKVDGKFMDYYEGREVPELVKGFSGSGIFANIDDELYLLGIISLFRRGGEFVCPHIHDYFKEKTKIYRYHEEATIPNHRLTLVLEQTLKQLKPRYTDKNLSLPIEKQLDSFVGNLAHSKFLSELFEENLVDVIAFLTDQDKFLNNFLKKSGKIKCADGLTFRNKLNQIKSGLQTIIDLSEKHIENCRENEILVELEDTINSSIEKLEDLNHNFANLTITTTELQTLTRRINNRLRYFNNLFFTLRFNQNKILLVKSKAGLGKSQLLGFTAKKWSDQQQPCILVLGQSLSEHESPWNQIRKQISIKDCTKEEFLFLLDKKGEQAKHPVVIFIDAINEGKGIPLWNQFYESFVQELVPYDWIKVVLSYRTTYERALFDGISIDNNIVIDHTGFKGHEQQAVEFFFQESGIPAPDLPNYSENFSNPLFLKLFVIYYKKFSHRYEHNELLGISKIFKNFFNYINYKLGKDRDNGYESEKLDLVGLCIKRFIATLSESSKDYINYLDSYILIENEVKIFLEKPGFLKSLISEDLFSESIYWNDDNEYEYGIVFAYQKMGDFLLAQHLLQGKTLPQLKDLKSKRNKRILRYLADSEYAINNLGVLESMCVQLAEIHGVEIFDVWPNFIDNQLVEASFISSLNDRNQKSFTKNTIEHLKRILTERKGRNFDIWQNVLAFIFEPGNSLNVNFLHEFLVNLQLNERDATWTVFINHYESLEDGNVMSRILNRGTNLMEPDPQKQDELFAVLKVCFWFLSSSNRQLRDDTTKKLILILSHNYEHLLPLLKLFEDVNDPYIKQRIYAIALGSSLRTKNKNHIAPVAVHIYQTVFNKSNVVADILLRDYARLTVEYYLFLFENEKIDIKKVRPPYKSSKIKRFPSNDSIDKYPVKFGYNKNEIAGIHQILSSMVTEYGRPGNMYGDFGRYTFGSAFKQWKDLNDNHLSNLAIQLIVEKYGYDRVLSDLDIGRYSRSRNPQTVERIGKKYQWIVFHELLAIVSDHHKFSLSWNQEDNDAKFEGPWNPNVRDFDPTELSFKSEKSIETMPGGFKYEFPDVDNLKWLNSQDFIPDPRELITYTDQNGEEWLILEISKTWNDNLEYSKSEKSIWFQIRSYITKEPSHSKIVNWANKQNFMGRWMPESTTRTSQFLGEFFWSPSSNSFRNQYEGGQLWQELYGERGGKKIGEVSVTALEYLWEKETEGSKSIMIPNEYLYNILELQPTEINAEFINSENKIIAFDPSYNDPNISALVVNKNALLQKLKEHGLNIFWTVLGEKQLKNISAGGGSNFYRPTEISMVLNVEGNEFIKTENIIIKEN